MSDTPQQDRFTKWFDEQKSEATGKKEVFDVKFTLNPNFKGSNEQVFAEIMAFVEAAETGETEEFRVSDEDLNELD